MLEKYCGGSKWIEPEDKNAALRWQCLLMHVFMAKASIECSRDQIPCYIEIQELQELIGEPLSPWSLLRILFPFDPFFPPGAFSSILQKTLLFTMLPWPWGE